MRTFANLWCVQRRVCTISRTSCRTMCGKRWEHIWRISHWVRRRSYNQQADLPHNAADSRKIDKKEKVCPCLRLFFKTFFILKYGCGLDRWCRCVRSCIALCVCGVLFGVLVVCCCDLCLLVCWLASRCSCVVLVFLSVFVVFCSVCLWCFAVFCVSWCAGWLGGVLVLFLWCFVFLWSSVRCACGVALVLLVVVSSSRRKRGG